MRFYKVYDKIAKEYSPVFEAGNDFLAKRNVAQKFSKVSPIVLRDYELYCIAESGTKEGEFERFIIQELIPLNDVFDYLEERKANAHMEAGRCVKR